MLSLLRKSSSSSRTTTLSVAAVLLQHCRSSIEFALSESTFIHPTNALGAAASLAHHSSRSIPLLELNTCSLRWTACKVTSSWCVITSHTTRGTHSTPGLMHDGSATTGRQHEKLKQPQRVQRWQPHAAPGSAATPRTPPGRVFSEADTPQQLLWLVRKHADRMDAAAVVSAYTCLGKQCQWDPWLASTADVLQLLQRLDQLLLQPSVQQQQQQLRAKELSTIMWACAHAQHPALISKLLPAFLQPETLSAATVFDISNVIWAAATADAEVSTQHLEQLLAAYVEQRGGPRANPQCIAQTLWAVAKMNRPQLSEEQVQEIVLAFVRQLPSASPQHTSTALWAVAEMGHQVPPEHLERMLRLLAKQLSVADPQAVSMSLWACAKFQRVPLHLIKALEPSKQHLLPLLQTATPQAIANMAWALAQMAYGSEQLLAALLQHALLALDRDTGNTFSCQGLCNLCWSAAVFDLQQQVPAVLQLAEACSKMWDSVAPKDLQQLYQVHLWLLDCQLLPAGVQKGLLGVLSEQQLEQCRSSWEQQLEGYAARDNSPYRQHVFDTLQRLPASTWQQQPVMEQRTADGAFSIDIAAVTAAGVRLAIEVDGRWHFTSPRHKFNGPTQYRNRALAARGYTVISIPYREWRRVKGAAARLQYIISKIPGAAAAAASFIVQ